MALRVTSHGQKVFAKTPLVQRQRHRAAQAAPAVAVKKPAEGIEVRLHFIAFYAELKVPF